jgi:hypothetical protein
MATFTARLAWDDPDGSGRTYDTYIDVTAASEEEALNAAQDVLEMNFPPFGYVDTLEENPS